METHWIIHPTNGGFLSNTGSSDMRCSSGFPQNSPPRAYKGGHTLPTTTLKPLLDLGEEDGIPAGRMYDKHVA